MKEKEVLYNLKVMFIKNLQIFPVAVRPHMKANKSNTYIDKGR